MRTQDPPRNPTPYWRLLVPLSIFALSGLTIVLLLLYSLGQMYARPRQSPNELWIAAILLTLGLLMAAAFVILRPGVSRSEGTLPRSRIAIAAFVAITFVLGLGWLFVLWTIITGDSMGMRIVRLAGLPWLILTTMTTTFFALRRTVKPASNPRS